MKLRLYFAWLSPQCGWAFDLITMLLFFFLFGGLLALPVLWPEADLLASGFFYRAGQGFALANHWFFLSVHELAFFAPRFLGVVLAVLAFFAWKKKNFFLDSKSCVFLLLALLIGPGLIANAGFKDHWGRARPREIAAFGGGASFSSPLAPRFENARPNGSFVAGDAAFGFFLPSFAYVAPRRSSRRVFWAGLAGGCLFGFARIAMGAHFLSDVIYAAFFMLLTGAILHAAMFGRDETKARWKLWLSAEPLRRDSQTTAVSS